MFTPEPFQPRPEAVEAFLSKYAFATVITEGPPLRATHCPVLARAAPESPLLEAHFARANPHCAALAAGLPSLVIFPGPHAYISPRWYHDRPAVPTWNYGVVHVHGIPRVVEQPEAVRGHLRRLVARFEGPDGLPEDVLTDDLVERLRAGIVLFEMRSLRIEGKFKLGQNRSREDQRSVRRHLEASPDAQSRDLAAFMGEFGDLAEGD